MQRSRGHPWGRVRGPETARVMAAATLMAVLFASTDAIGGPWVSALILLLALVLGATLRSRGSAAAFIALWIGVVLWVTFTRAGPEGEKLGFVVRLAWPLVPLSIGCALAGYMGMRAREFVRRRS